MPTPGAWVVEGEEEVNRALNQVANFNVEAAGSRVADTLLPDIAAKTRVLSGALAASWQSSGAQFINTMDYSVVQEFGSIHVEPTHAIFQTWEAQAENITEVFAEEIKNAASQAGFDT